MGTPVARKVLMLIGELCTRELCVAERDVSIPDAAKLMRAFHVGDLVIVEERNGAKFPIGIVTDRDLVVSVLAEGTDRIDTLTVGDVMSRSLVTARDSMDVTEVLKMMRVHGVRRMPIVGVRGELVGIVSFDELFELLAEEVQDLAGLLVREQRHEREVRDLGIAGASGTRH